MANLQENCIFCEVLPNPRSAFDVSQPIGNGNVSIMPTLGMLLPGYLLAVSREHITSFAQLSSDRLQEVDGSLANIDTQLSPLFGDYFRCESGSDNVAQFCGSGGCIDHAHQHLVPAADVGTHILKALPWEQMDAYEDIAAYRGKPYIYLGKAGLHYIVPEPNLPGQWMRRQLADIRNLRSWDYALDPGLNNLNETLTKLKTNSTLGQLAIKSMDLMTDIG